MFSCLMWSDSLDPEYKPYIPKATEEIAKKQNMKTRIKRESHAKMMLGLAMTRLARLNAGTAQFSEITIAAQEVERWKQALADESLPLVRK